MSIFRHVSSCCKITYDNRSFARVGGGIILNWWNFWPKYLNVLGLNRNCPTFFIPTDSVQTIKSGYCRGGGGYMGIPVHHWWISVFWELVVDKSESFPFLRGTMLVGFDIQIVSFTNYVKTKITYAQIPIRLNNKG